MNPTMNNDMMAFGMDTPALENTTWWKRDGSDHFTIRDVLMAPEGFSIRTTDGRVLSGDVMDTYIQSDIPINIPKQAPAVHVSTTELNAGIEEGAGVAPEPDPLHRTFGSLKHNHPGMDTAAPTPMQEKPIDDVDMAMIRRVLDGVDMKAPSISFIKTPELESALDTLVNTLKVNQDTLVRYLEDRFSDGISTGIRNGILILCGLADTPTE